MTINQELADLDLPKRTSLIVYLRNANSDQFKLRRFGDIVYFSKKMHYLIMYVDQEKVEEMLQQLEKLTFVKKVEVSEADQIDLDNQQIEDQIKDLAKEAEEILNDDSKKKGWMK